MWTSTCSSQHSPKRQLRCVAILIRGRRILKRFSGCDIPGWCFPSRNATLGFWSSHCPKGLNRNDLERENRNDLACEKLQGEKREAGKHVNRISFLKLGEREASTSPEWWKGWLEGVPLVLGSLQTFLRITSREVRKPQQII